MPSVSFALAVRAQAPRICVSASEVAADTVYLSLRHFSFSVVRTRNRTPVYRWLALNLPKRIQSRCRGQSYRLRLPRQPGYHYTYHNGVDVFPNTKGYFETAMWLI
jgi:hypothetical protein